MGRGGGGDYSYENFLLTFNTDDPRTIVEKVGVQNSTNHPCSRILSQHGHSQFFYPLKATGCLLQKDTLTSIISTFKNSPCFSDNLPCFSDSKAEHAESNSQAQSRASPEVGNWYSMNPKTLMPAPSQRRRQKTYQRMTTCQTDGTDKTPEPPDYSMVLRRWQTCHLLPRAYGNTLEARSRSTIDRSLWTGGHHRKCTIRNQLPIAARSKWLLIQARLKK
jgi:hypothetical protein